MTRPNLLSIIAIGPQKTATTWLARALDACDGFSLPTEVKETFFWERNFAKGEGWYFRHFHSTGLGAEIGPTYFHSLEATTQLRAHNPALKIIVTLRDPAERAHSLYLHHVRKGRTRKGFREAIADFPEILEASHYSKHLQRWIKAFGAAQILVLLQDDIERAPSDVLKQIGAFLGHKIDVGALDVSKRVNAGGVPRSHSLAALSTKIAEALRALGLYRVINFAKSMGLKNLIYGASGRTLPALDARDRIWLVSQFEDDIRFVEKHLSVPLDHWRSAKKRAS